MDMTFRARGCIQGRNPNMQVPAGQKITAQTLDCSRLSTDVRAGWIKLPFPPLFMHTESTNGKLATNSVLFVLVLDWEQGRVPVTRQGMTAFSIFLFVYFLPSFSFLFPSFSFLFLPFPSFSCLFLLFSFCFPSVFLLSPSVSLSLSLFDMVKK